MKKILILAAFAVLASPAFAAQGNNITVPVVPRKTLPPASTAVRTEGALQRGVRIGNPVQMFNPFAPGGYGDGREFVTPRDEDPGLRPRDKSRAFPIGLRLFSVAF